MEPTLTSTALVLHNLGLAAGFGGSLFGKVSMNPAVKVIEDRTERGKVLDAAWKGYRWVNLASIGAAALTWVAGRTALSGRAVSSDAQPLVIAKDALLATGLVCTVVSVAGGAYMGAQTGGYLPVETGNIPAADTPEDKQVAQRVVSIASTLNLIAIAGVIGLTAWLTEKAGASRRWGIVARLLP